MHNILSCKRITNWIFILALLLLTPFFSWKTPFAMLVDAVGNYDFDANILPPKKLSQTGLYTNIEAKSREVTVGIVPFEINAALWNDNAKLTRWIQLPTGSTITPTDTDHFDFPDKTIMVKNLALDTVLGDSNTSLLIETQIMVVRKIGLGFQFRGMSYAWRRDQSDADLVDPDDGLNAIVNIKANGVEVGKRWQFFNRRTCSDCHANRGGLGFITPQLNRPSLLNPSINQLQAFFKGGILSFNPLDLHPNALKWAAIDDTSAPLELRARSYLGANCSHCHGNGRIIYWGPSHNFDFLNKDAPYIFDANNLVDLGAYVGRPTGGNSKYPMFLKPGAPDSSSVIMRMLNRGTFEAPELFQMPPYGTYQVDSAGLRVLADWTCELGRKSIGTTCRLPDVPQSHIWSLPSSSIQPHFKPAHRLHGNHPMISKGILYLFGDNRNVINEKYANEHLIPINIFDLRGNELPIHQVGDGVFEVPDDLRLGLYMLRWQGNFYLVNSGN